MLKHVVMWRIRDPRIHGPRLKALLEALPAVVPGIRTLEVGINEIADESAADVVLYSAFDDEAALAAYQRHPEHLKVAEFLKPLRLERRVVDYRVP